ncbi:dihydrofolate reductase family protein [Yinghuangia soli]|uniref:Dihydrofolate reductase family protein n=1 Tax=Yinghuangia soli TaxID=2908204 RepID=A0AA41Q7A1_9ACTN|nr:dihydrofolate reductase family protein [Yinghuangia soli]MCF2531654.1 dihydrofolate reductase family protein [Yinghuangia soli]
MATVIAAMTMSLDGFIADPDDRVDDLFGWYDNGDVEIPTTRPDLTFKVTPPSAGYLHKMVDSVGAVVTGRRLFDLTDGWGGNHPFGCPIFLVSHSVPPGWPRPDLPVTIVTDGLESAVAQAKKAAGEKAVGIGGANVIQQCLSLGLIDEVRVELVPVLMGRGIRYFDHLSGTPVRLSDPEVIEGKNVTHLRYTVL